MRDPSPSSIAAPTTPRRAGKAPESREAKAAAGSRTPSSSVTPPTASADMSNPTSLRERYQDVRRRIAVAAKRDGRAPDDVLLVAVTKHATPEQIRELVELGHADFGENRVQNLARRVALIDEFMDRHRTLTASRPVNLPAKVRWHMIGHLQRNKVRKALDLVTLIHSVDTLRLAEEIQDAALRREEPVDVLLQVNASFEKTKSGVALPAAIHLAEQIDTMVHLRLRGVMCMAPLTEDVGLIRAAFERGADCFADIQKEGIGGRAFNLLSMGMTNDFELAIECGANVVRIGTAIFGPPITTPLDDELDEADEDAADT